MLGRLRPMAQAQAICVVGCGPVPQPIRILRSKGHNATGVEPVPSFVQRAHEYLSDDRAVMIGAAAWLLSTTSATSFRDTSLV